MTKPAPRRRHLTRDLLDVETTLKRAAVAAPEVELGWSVLRQEMRDAGWPTRTPDDDRTRTSARITILCRDCNMVLLGSAAKDTHRDQTGHELYAYQPIPRGDPSCIDYADPCGNLALRLNHLADDLEQMQDHWRSVTASLRHMADISRRYMPASSAHKPACSVGSCDQDVEHRVMPHGATVYVGMETIAGVWVARPGVQPMCAKHRAVERRTA